MRLPCPACLAALGIRFLLAASLLAGTGFNVLADDNVALPPERALAVESYGLDQGLAQSSVISLAEDSKGFLWFGTQEGLHRFDGHRFDVLRREPGDPDSLVSSTMDVLTVDRRERLWMGSNDAGVEVIDLASLERWRFTPEQGLSHARVTGLAVLPSGQSAVVATAAGVDRIDLAERSVSNLISRDGLIGLVRSNDADWLVADRNCRLEFSDGRRLRPDLPESAVCVALTRAPDGTAWLATGQGELVHIHPESISVISDLARSNALEARISTLYAEDDGRLLIGDSKGGIIEWHPGSPSQHSRWQIDIGDSAVLKLYRDSSGVLWIGTYTHGLHRVLPMSETVLAGDRSASFDPVQWPSGSVRAIRRDDDRGLLGTDSGLFVQAAGDGEWRQLPALAGVPVRVLAADESGSAYWLGTHQGLWRWQPPDAPYPIVSDSLPDQRITDLAEHEGRVWITTRAGLAVVVDGRLRPELVPEALRQRFLTTLEIDDRGSVWVGTNEDGVFRFQPNGEPEHFFAGTREQASESVWAIHVEGDRIWLGTFGGGLLRLDRSGELERRVTDADGLPNNVIYRILPDREGRLWMSTNNGLGVVDTRSGQVQQLGRRDGLTNQEFNAGAAWQDGSGTLYFGGVDGVDSVNSTAFSFDSPAARPVLDGLTVTHREIGLLERFAGLDASLPYAGEIRLDHRQRIFALRMVALDFNAPSAARLRYRVDGLHDNWVQVNGAKTEFSVNYLAPGRYRLRLQAAGRDGRFGNEHVMIMVLVPPLWRHPAAYALYGLLLVFLLALIAWRVRLNMHHKRRQVEILHQQVAKRTAELEKLNEKLHRSNRKLDLATRRDPLTGLSNRRDFLDWVEKQQSRQDPSPRPRLLFLMIDIDDFKMINDRRGHAVGDQVLVAFGQRLDGFCRQQDILVRWGGEEFLLVVNDVDHAMGADLAERICRAVSKRPLLTAGGEALSVTCSVGYAPWPIVGSATEPSSWELSVELADRALYAAKAAGKNGWYGLLPGQHTRRDFLDELSAGKPLSDLLDRDILEAVSSSPTP
ncbi:ligand-binding sensor domain-containing protein [Wenzhouxiangella sp. EGI_FJ10305]|uniref:ligand-binding sensor domain-containing protein n=1 Tax=Wenzhouxiangella sp. EGI_FJ10305 TaxID=3243768 RepID=UPI0035DD5280